MCSGVVCFYFWLLVKKQNKTMLSGTQHDFWLLTFVYNPNLKVFSIFVKNDVSTGLPSVVVFAIIHRTASAQSTHQSVFLEA